MKYFGRLFILSSLSFLAFHASAKTEEEDPCIDSKRVSAATRTHANKFALGIEAITAEDYEWLEIHNKYVVMKIIGEVDHTCNAS